MVLPSEQVIRFVIQQTATLQNHLGKEIGRRALVLPNGKFFPDKFTGDSASVTRLMRRIQEHAGMTDVPIETKVLGGEPAAAAPAETQSGKPHPCKGDCGGKGCVDCDGSCHDKKQAAPQCGSGCGSGCGTPTDAMGNEPRLVDLGESWRVQVPFQELKQPMVLTTNLARAVGFIFLVETRSAAQPVPDNLDAAADLVGTLLGFGALLLGGAHIYSKSCGGPQIRRITALGCGELALATVLSAHYQQQDLRPMLRELDATQKAAVTEAEQWLRERPLVLERFASDPARLERGEIPMAGTAAGLWSRWFGKRTPGADSDPESSIAELEAMLAEAPLSSKTGKPPRRDPRADELRALVDEALADTGSQIQ
jgi:hypothetical protein